MAAPCNSRWIMGTREESAASVAPCKIRSEKNERRHRRQDTTAGNVTSLLQKWPWNSLPCFQQMVQQHLLIKLPKQNPQGRRSTEGLSLFGNTPVERPLRWEGFLWFRVQNEHICLRLGFRETHTETGYYWGVLPGETPQGSEGNRKLQDTDSQCEQEAQMLPWGEPRPGYLFRRFLCETRCLVITSPKGQYTVIGGGFREILST